MPNRPEPRLEFELNCRRSSCQFSCTLFNWRKSIDELTAPKVSRRKQSALRIENIHLMLLRGWQPAIRWRRQYRGQNEGENPTRLNMPPGSSRHLASDDTTHAIGRIRENRLVGTFENTLRSDCRPVGHIQYSGRQTVVAFVSGP